MTVSRDLFNYKEWSWCRRGQGWKEGAEIGGNVDFEAIDVQVRDFRAV